MPVQTLVLVLVSVPVLVLAPVPVPVLVLVLVRMPNAPMPVPVPRVKHMSMSERTKTLWSMCCSVLTRYDLHGPWHQEPKSTRPSPCWHPHCWHVTPCHYRAPHEHQVWHRLGVATSHDPWLNRLRPQGQRPAKALPPTGTARFLVHLEWFLVHFEWFLVHFEWVCRAYWRQQRQ